MFNYSIKKTYMLSTDEGRRQRTRSCADLTTSKRPRQNQRPTSAKDEFEPACSWWLGMKRKCKAFHPQWCSFQSNSERSFHPADEKIGKLENLLIKSTQKCCCGQFPRNADAICQARILSIKTSSSFGKLSFSFWQLSIWEPFHFSLHLRAMVKVKWKGNEKLSSENLITRIGVERKMCQKQQPTRKRHGKVFLLFLLLAFVVFGRRWKCSATITRFIRVFLWQWKLGDLNMCTRREQAAKKTVATWKNYQEKEEKSHKVFLYHFIKGKFLFILPGAFKPWKNFNFQKTQQVL